MGIGGVFMAPCTKKLNGSALRLSAPLLLWLLRTGKSTTEFPERRRIMKTGIASLRTRIGKPLLAVLAFTLLVIPLPADSAERDGTALFFSLEDVTRELRSFTPSQLYSSFAWRTPQEQAGQESRIERSYRWGNGLGFDSYVTPGMRQPLWGY
jgi:hypothetical protein